VRPTGESRTIEYSCYPASASQAATASLNGMPPTTPHMTFEQRRAQREVTRLIGRIRALTVELEGLRRRDGGHPQLRAKERALEELRWELAAVARRAATPDLQPAA
jgi:hypothetical protein